MIILPFVFCIILSEFPTLGVCTRAGLAHLFALHVYKYMDKVIILLNIEVCLKIKNKISYSKIKGSRCRLVTVFLFYL